MKNNKGDMRLQFKENNFFRQVAPTSKKQQNTFSNTNISTTLPPPGPPVGPSGLKQEVANLVTVIESKQWFLDIGRDLLKTHLCLMPDWCCQKLGPNKHLFEISSHMKCKIHENAPKRCGRALKIALQPQYID